MNASNDFHRKAMEISARALADQMRGNEEQALELFQQALDLELSAIASLEDPVEPTFSVLHRSAATLALDCKLPRQAEKLVAYALAHEPPSEIADELRDLLEQVNFDRHLDLRGVVLKEDELQLSLSGAEIGFGLANAAEFQKRVTDSSRLIYRIAERRGNRPFRERGRPDSTIKTSFEPFLSMPRAASYAVTMRFGRPTRQMTFWEAPEITETVNEFMDLMEMLHNANMDDLRTRIPDAAYLRNFLGLAKSIAPDGNRIRLVGYTTFSKGVIRKVAVTRPAEDLPRSTDVDEEPIESEHIEISGTLLYADAIAQNRIRLIDSESKSHTIEVPKGMMTDIVKPNWDAVVTIKGIQQGNSILLQDIEAQD